MNDDEIDELIEELSQSQEFRDQVQSDLKKYREYLNSLRSKEFAQITKEDFLGEESSIGRSDVEGFDR